MKFKVVHTYGYQHENVIQEFETKVNEFIQEGYQPYGNIQTTRNSHEFSITLLMNKEDSDK